MTPRARSLIVASAILGVIGASCVGALAGYVMAGTFPASYEFAAFVREGSLDQKPLVLRPDFLDRINGLGAASEIGRHLNMSAWQVWRRYSVTAEGPLYVIRVHETDSNRGEQFLEAVRDTLVADLRQRYDAAMTPHRLYVAALEREVAALGEPVSSVAAGGPGASRAVSGGAANRRAAARIREQLRDAQVYAALSEVPEALPGVSRLQAPQNARRWRLTLTGAVLGFLVSFVVLVAVAWRWRMSPPLAGT